MREKSERWGRGNPKIEERCRNGRGSCAAPKQPVPKASQPHQDSKPSDRRE